MIALYYEDAPQPARGYEAFLIDRNGRIIVMGAASTARGLRAFLERCLRTSTAEKVRITHSGREVGTCEIGLVRFYKRVWERKMENGMDGVR